MSNAVMVVLDTNILVSSLWLESGNTASIIKRIPRLIIPCFNDKILSEYAEVLCRPKFSFSVDKRESLLSKIKDYGIEHLPDESEEAMLDEDDRIFYDTAKSSGSVLITGNIRHYPTALFIMTPSDFLKKYDDGLEG